MSIKKVRGDQVLIRESMNNEQKTASGIILEKKENAQDFLFGVVKYVGNGKVHPSGALVKVDLEEGEEVMFRYGTKFTLGGENLTLVNESDVILVLE